MLKCKDISQLVSRSLDSKLSLKERVGLQLHLLMCKYCMRFSQQLKKINVTINSMTKIVENDTNIKLPPEVKERIINSLDSSD